MDAETRGSEDENDEARPFIPPGFESPGEEDILQFLPYMSHNERRENLRSNSPQSMMTMNFNPPSESCKSIDENPCSSVHRLPNRVPNTANKESIRSDMSLFPHGITNSTYDDKYEPLHRAPSKRNGSQAFATDTSPELSIHSTFGDALFEPPESDLDRSHSLIAPSETDMYSGSSIHSSQQELALQQINSYDDWSS